MLVFVLHLINVLDCVADMYWTRTGRDRSTGGSRVQMLRPRKANVVIRTHWCDGLGHSRESEILWVEVTVRVPDMPRASRTQQNKEGDLPLSSPDRGVLRHCEC